MPICNKCGWKTNSDRIFKIHVKTCTVEPAELNDMPESITEHKVDWESHTKQEICDELWARGIEFNKRDNKAVLIELLEGGE